MFSLKRALLSVTVAVIWPAISLANFQSVDSKAFDKLKQSKWSLTRPTGSYAPMYASYVSYVSYVRLHNPRWDGFKFLGNSAAEVAQYVSYASYYGASSPTKNNLVQRASQVCRYFGYRHARYVLADKVPQAHLPIPLLTINQGVASVDEYSYDYSRQWPYSMVTPTSISAIDCIR